MTVYMSVILITVVAILTAAGGLSPKISYAAYIAGSPITPRRTGRVGRIARSSALMLRRFPAVNSLNTPSVYSRLRS
jgi:hypothetical protein